MFIINQQIFTTIPVKTLAQLEKLKLPLKSLVGTQSSITELISLATCCVSSPAARPRLLLTRFR